MKRLILVAALLALSSPGRADPRPAIHYAPVANLEHVDVALIDTAKNEIDLAAYVLTGWPVMQALTRAADRNVKVRISRRHPARRARSIEGLPLADAPGVEIRTKRKPSASCTSRATRVTAGCCARAPRTFQPRGSSARTMIISRFSLDPVRFAYVRRESPGPGEDEPNL